MANLARNRRSLRVSICFAARSSTKTEAANPKIGFETSPAELDHEWNAPRSFAATASPPDRLDVYSEELVMSVMAESSWLWSGEPGVVAVGADPPGQGAIAYAYSMRARARRAKVKPSKLPAVLPSAAKPGGS